MSNDKSIFNVLNNVDVSALTKVKGKFNYLSWSNAVREASKIFPDMNWKMTTWDSLPYLKTELGFFVECSVTIKGVEKTQMMAVLDFKNQTTMSPLANDINKAQMRALTKAIALHGLGLDLWAGEDINGEYESDGSQKVEVYIDEDQVAELCALLLDSDGNLNKKGNQIVKAYKLQSFNEIPVSKFDRILKDSIA